MASRKEETKKSLHGNLNKLRKITNSSAVNEASIISDASKYIEELKQKIEGNQKEAGSSEISSDQDLSPMVTVQTLNTGFYISVSSEKNSHSMLANVLEAIEELGLELLDARVSCLESFHLEAVGQQNEEDGNCVDAQMVKQAIMNACEQD